MDKDGRFIMYEGEYVGLSENSILDFDLKERKIIKRQSFDTRFSDFKEFVITMKRLPMQTGSDEEQSLARWMVNVLKSNIDSTEEQLLSLQEFLDDNKALPQNGHEYNFKQMCDQIKVVVNQPTYSPSYIIKRPSLSIAIKELTLFLFVLGNSSKAKSTKSSSEIGSLKDRRICSK